ncbi:hypothetical protein SBBP2_870003 [Burkholderiales bacterium]|jgi:hypothetical protein|nr:hypothetical protein SBBP2_870003 [Burkholderiales bacterium]
MMAACSGCGEKVDEGIIIKAVGQVLAFYGLIEKEISRELLEKSLFHIIISS